MDRTQAFFSPAPASLKICGVTSRDDANQLAALAVPALGVNFWPQSKRYCPPEIALEWLTDLADQIVRVGVFVNNARSVAPSLLENKALDAVQLHGDEDEAELEEFLTLGIPVIRSLSLNPDEDLAAVAVHYQGLSQRHDNNLALLLDAHAPGVYGGTGKTIDWNQAARFIALSAPLPVFLAGGIVPENAREAIITTRPAALDVASGAETSPGEKDFRKVAALLAANPSPSEP